MKRPAAWQLEKQRTAKAMRELPKCETEGCTGMALGAAWGDASRLCTLCRIKELEAQRARRERA